MLQIVKIRNISAPKANEGSGHAPRMLQVHLSDGHQICSGIEYEKLQGFRYFAECRLVRSVYV